MKKIFYTMMVAGLLSLGLSGVAGAEGFKPTQYDPKAQKRVSANSQVLDIQGRIPQEVRPTPGQVTPDLNMYKDPAALPVSGARGVTSRSVQKVTTPEIEEIEARIEKMVFGNPVNMRLPVPKPLTKETYGGYWISYYIKNGNLPAAEFLLSQELKAVGDTLPLYKQGTVMDAVPVRQPQFPQVIAQPNFRGQDACGGGACVESSGLCRDPGYGSVCQGDSCVPNAPCVGAACGAADDPCQDTPSGGRICGNGFLPDPRDPWSPYGRPPSINWTPFQLEHFPSGEFNGDGLEFVWTRVIVDWNSDGVPDRVMVYTDWILEWPSKYPYTPIYVYESTHGDGRFDVLYDLRRGLKLVDLDSDGLFDKADLLGIVM